MSELRAAGVLSAARKVGRAALVCHLSVGGRSYPVIDLQEDIAALGGGPTRAWHRVIVLRPNGGEASELTYFPPARPLTCSRNVLVFSAPVEVENTLPEGRRVAFDAGAAHAAVVEER